MTLLKAEHLFAGYNGYPVVNDLNIEVAPGEVVGLLGPNGAGKTTTLLTLSGDIPAISGTVTFDGHVTDAPLHRRARGGLSFVTEERSVFMRLSVADNLKVGSADPALAVKLFPELKPLMRRTTGLLSGGEQQMLTLARALVRETKLLLADELSLGLAPLVVMRLLRAVRTAASERGIGVLLVEQQVRHTLSVADSVYVMSRGSIVLQGPAAEMTARLGDIESSYLGMEAVPEPPAADDGTR